MTLRRSIVAVPLMDEEFVLVAAPVWAECIGPVDGPGALHGIPLVTYAEDLPIARRYRRHVFHTRLTDPPAVVVPTCAACSPAASWYRSSPRTTRPSTPASSPSAPAHPNALT